MEFSWDRGKAQRNLRKHGITFEEAVTIFADPFEIGIYDPDHSVLEDRFCERRTFFGWPAPGRGIHRTRE